MTITKAIRKATRFVELSPQGQGWIVYSYDAEHRAWRSSQEMPYSQARTALAESRIECALVALGHDASEAHEVAYWMAHNSGTWISNLRAANRVLLAQKVAA